MNRIAFTCIAALAAALVAGCGERREAPVQPPPLGRVHAPDTSELGAGPPSGIMGGARVASCGASVEEALARINAARAAGFRCGGRAMGPSSPLKWDPSLFSAAEGHSLDMAKRNYFEHRSPEGQDVSHRVSATPYKWRSVGENLAGGDRTVAEAIQGWLESPQHCENMLDPKYRDVALACEARSGTEWGTYWTMVLGRR